jgi:hypothetical protein
LKNGQGKGERTAERNQLMRRNSGERKISKNENKTVKSKAIPVTGRGGL